MGVHFYVLFGLMNNFWREGRKRGKSVKGQSRWLCNAESYVEGQISAHYWLNIIPSDPDFLITSHHLCLSLTFVTTSQNIHNNHKFG